jgi:hypothetical protein
MKTEWRRIQASSNGREALDVGVENIAADADMRELTVTFDTN